MNNNETTSLWRASKYVLVSAGLILAVLLLVGCQTSPGPVNPNDLEFPPTTMALPKAVPVWAWEVAEALPVRGVRLEWSYPEAERSNIVFRVYGSERPKWDTNWSGWYCVGETPGLEFSRYFGPIRPGADREFYTLTASNTLTGLESDPARRE